MMGERMTEAALWNLPPLNETTPVVQLVGAALALQEGFCTERAEVERLEGVLREIAKGEGPFSMDHMTHASNTIDAMRKLATDALGLT